MKRKLLWAIVALLMLAIAWRLSWPRFLPVERMYGEPQLPESFEEMVNRAELIVLTDIKSVKQGPDYLAPIVGTDSVYHEPNQRVTLEVVKVYKGDVTPGQSVTLFQGSVGVTRSIQDHPWPVFRINENDPVYKRGERYILMLWPVLISEEIKPYQPEPWQEGVFSVIHPGRMRLTADGTVTSVLDPFGTNSKTLGEIEERIAAAAKLTSESHSSFLDIMPPSSTLEINGATQISAIGTYCWSEEGKGSACADMIGIPTPRQALTISSPTTAQLSLPIAASPADLHLTVIRVTGEDEMQENARGYHWWNYQEGQSSQLPLQSQQDIQIDLDPGLYVLSIQVWWDKEGDVVYGFLVDVH
jgi:hypothetical protein